ncbi:ABC transporter permease [Myceligenerans pegani]|uniref:ABC transporter permease n=1 Tax=Myceligenerans pegani TaxID=2776917 RepID=A0ABR9MYV9_9MICO|nr:ABC transporter permease [Myceligenerans sp. TRM 65318]MBE1876590.1 ABC transporter permease [Myceligenerans sp. TRM 65318]MBE3018861.1 ABC transporter permease [Myceligenerans sp. TRM 65318]
MSALVGTVPMLALTARRERSHMPAWYGLAALLLVVVGAGILGTYPTEAARTELAQTVNTDAGELFLIGPMHGTSIGSLILWRTQGIATIFIGLASILVVTRNTRSAEENGTSELLGASAIGRAAPLGAALVVAATGSLVAGVIIAGGFLTLGADVGGSLLVGAQVFTVGLLFAGVAGIVGQIVRTGRAATGLSVTVLAALFLTRGAVDASGGSPWLSPLGWTAAARPFTDNNVLTLLPALALAAVTIIASIRIAAGRDLGAGLLPDRAGRAQASTLLRGPFSLALRVSRGAIIGWTLGAVVVGLLIGSVASTVDQQADLDIGGSGPGLANTAVYLAPEVITVLALVTVLRLRSEAASGRAEILLARPVRRGHWLLAHAATAAVAALVALAGFGLGIGLGTGADVLAWVWAAVVRAPAVWILLALVAALLATAPGLAAGTGFTVLALLLALEFVVELQILPPQAYYASPFALVPQLPDGPGHPGYTALLLLVTAALLALALRRIRYLDIR